MARVGLISFSDGRPYVHRDIAAFVAESENRIAAWLGPALERCARFALLQHPPVS